jgi:hypothetical protein
MAVSHAGEVVVEHAVRLGVVGARQAGLVEEPAVEGIVEAILGREHRHALAVPLAAREHLELPVQVEVTSARLVELEDAAPAADGELVAPWTGESSSTMMSRNSPTPQCRWW